jgi:hypothetical protein
MTATTTTSGLVQAGTTKLYHEVRGGGPASLITGGTGDAAEWTHLAPTLAEDCTVVTYDRRGMFRSDPQGMQASGVALTVVAGAQNPRHLDGGAAAWLAEGPGRPPRAARWARRVRQPPAGVHRAGTPHRQLTCGWWSPRSDSNR